MRQMKRCDCDCCATTCLAESSRDLQQSELFAVEEEVVVSVFDFTPPPHLCSRLLTLHVFCSNASRRGVLHQEKVQEEEESHFATLLLHKAPACDLKPRNALGAEMQNDSCSIGLWVTRAVLQVLIGNVMALWLQGSFVVMCSGSFGGHCWHTWRPERAFLCSGPHLPEAAQLSLNKGRASVSCAFCNLLGTNVRLQGLGGKVRRTRNKGIVVLAGRRWT